MQKSFLLWLAAIIITAGAAVFQRMTGPSYPYTGETRAGIYNLHFVLPRTHNCGTDLPVQINTGDIPLSGKIIWKRYKSYDKYSVEFMTRENGVLKAYLPQQPPAGKLEYSVVLHDKNDFEYYLTDDPVVMRYKGSVPPAILIPHIAVMFFAMLFSTRTGLEIFNDKTKLKSLTITTLILLFAGGLILGPLTQLYAFGALWTGFPFGTDLTDNKTLIAFTGWLIAAVAVMKFKHPERWTMAASILLLLIFLIPHSMFGSELKYNEQQNNNSEQIIINK